MQKCNQRQTLFLFFSLDDSPSLGFPNQTSQRRCPLALSNKSHISVMLLRFFGLPLVDTLPMIFRHPTDETRFQVESLGRLSRKLGASRRQNIHSSVIQCLDISGLHV